ncbi:MAG: restriction endonuclease, partial [Sedimentibacter sp.]
MNKTAIKNFAIWARNKLIADIKYKAGLLGITEKEIKKPLSQSTPTVQFFDIGTKEPYSIIGIEIEQRKKLVEEIQNKAKQEDYKTAYKSVVEEVAYTWFNRLIAVRFMEVNDYLPTHIRVLSSQSISKSEPDLVTNPLDADLDYTPYEKDRIVQLKNDNKLDELFEMLFIKQCNKLNDVLPELFEKTNDYTELLLNASFTDKDGVVYHLVHDIDEDDFKEAVEIIGWMYQYYISEKHEEVINVLSGKVIKKEDIPAATQLFTTDWVVRYMVDNSLGRYWIERNPKSKLKEKLEFFVAQKDDDIKYIDEKVDPTELTFFDPCMGSGHILVYAFDVLLEIYREQGYSDRDAALFIVQYNLFGLDIDNRAY